MDHTCSKQQRLDSSCGAMIQGPSQALDSTAHESWQSAFFEAIIETRRSRVVPVIRDAQSILRHRLAEVASDPLGYAAEMQDLRTSLTYLSILLECVGNKRGELLWK